MTANAGDFPMLAERLGGVFAAGIGATLADESFNELALAVFRFQCSANPAYGAFVEARGVWPEGVERWQEIPHLPTLAFKDRPLLAGDPALAERVFFTSGTTGGQGKRGEHHVLSLELYRQSLIPNFLAHLLPEGEALPVLCLLPSPEVAPESSLSFMMGEVIRVLDRTAGEGPGHGFYMDGGGRLRFQELQADLERAAEEDMPVLLAGTAFAFVHWLETTRQAGWRISLPPGSRIMETGGYKGRVRALPRAELYTQLEAAFGIPVRSVVNEYGMTELLSQFYEPVLASSQKGEGLTESGAETTARALERRFHRGPPWVRTRVLNPLTLDPVAAEEEGILAHFDLANAGSVSAILTEDLGREVSGGFQLLGRSPGAEPRGCSLAMEDFLASGGGEG